MAPLGSVSAYYYTPAQAFFVGGLIGLGACMIALKGTTPVEDVFLNLGGVFAALVALVPTGRPADQQAAVDACKEAGTPLLTQKASTGQLGCPDVQALEAAAKANVDNNLAALLIVGAFVLVAAFVIARKDAPLKRQADGDAVRRRPGEVTRQSLNAVGDTVRELTAFGRRDWYNWARVTLVVAAVTLVLWWIFHLITLFWVEAAVFVFFMVFWTVQTFELERSTKPAAVPPPSTNSPSTYGALASAGGGSATPTCRNAPPRRSIGLRSGSGARTATGRPRSVSSSVEVAVARPADCPGAAPPAAGRLAPR